MSIEGSGPAVGEFGISLHHVRSSELTYEPFYGLKQKPFSLSSDPSFFYNSNAHTAAFNALLTGISRRETLSVLSGDIGMGKTTLCRTVLQHLDRQTLSAFVPDPFASREDLLKVILADFGVVSPDDLAAGRLRGASRTELSYLLYEFLDTLAPLQAFAVVFIDEAQNLSVPLLEEIRILSESDRRSKPLQVVLVGQLELRDKLRLPEMRQLAQRVAVRCTIEALDRDGVAGYISHRLHVAGGAPDRIRLSHEAIDVVHDLSGGVPRVINRLCDRALHHANARRASVVDPALVRMAAADVDPTALTAPVPAADTSSPVSTGVEEARSDAVKPAAPSVNDAELSETWFASVDAHVSSTPDPVDSVDLTTTGEFVSVIHPRGRDRSRQKPLTHMQRLRHVWWRRMKIAALVAIVIGGAGFGLSVGYTFLNQPIVAPAIQAPSVTPRPVRAVTNSDAPVLDVAPVDVPTSTSDVDAN